MGVYIPNMKKPKNCIECKFTSPPEGECWFVHSPKDCPLIEIVQCKDCKWWNEDHKTGGEGLCENNIFGWSRPTDFCPFGERRSETLDERIKRGLEEWKEK
jgi:hypothetical protein